MARTGLFGVEGLAGFEGICRCRSAGADVKRRGGRLASGRGGGNSGTSTSWTVPWDFLASCAITASYKRSISSCLAALSASITFGSKETTLPGLTGLLIPLLILFCALDFFFNLRGLYQGFCVDVVLIGDAPKVRATGLTISMASELCDDCACLRSRLPTVKNNVPRIKMLPM